MRKIPTEKFKMIYKLMKTGMSINQISKNLNINFSSVRNYIIAKEKGFNSYSEYQKSLKPKKISDKKIRMTEELIEKNLSYAEIARKTNLPYSMVFNYAKAKEKGFRSFKEYLDHLEAKITPPEKLELINKMFDKGMTVSEISRKTNFSISLIYEHTRAKQRGFASPNQYKNYLSQQRGFQSAYEYKLYIVNRKKSQKFLKSEPPIRHTKYNIKKSDFASKAEYEKYLKGLRQSDPINRQLGLLLKNKLAESNKTGIWFANQLGIRSATVSGYISGRTKPVHRLQERFFQLLNLPYKTVEEFARDLNLEKKNKVIV